MIGCHLGCEVVRGGKRYWSTLRFGYCEAVFSDAKRLREVNSITTFMALEWALQQGFDYYDIGLCLARPDDGLLKWKRRRGGDIDSLGNHAYLFVRLPKTGTAKFLWDTPMFAVEATNSRCTWGCRMARAMRRLPADTTRWCLGGCTRFISTVAMVRVSPSWKPAQPLCQRAVTAHHGKSHVQLSDCQGCIDLALYAGFKLRHQGRTLHGERHLAVQCIVRGQAAHLDLGRLSLHGAQAAGQEYRHRPQEHRHQELGHCSRRNHCVPGGHFLPGQLERVTGWEGKRFYPYVHPARTMEGGISTLQGPTRGYLIKDVWLVDGALYKGKASHWLSLKPSTFPTIIVDNEIDRAAIYCTQNGNSWFGTWLMEDCPTYALACNEAYR